MPNASGTTWSNPGGDWWNLIDNIYGPIVANNNNGWESSYNKTNKWPLNFGPTGEYYAGSWGGYIGGRARNGNWWSGTSGGYQPGRYSYHLSVINSGGDADSGITQTNLSHGDGSAIRCVVRS